MKVLICGDRNWTDRKLIRERLKELKPNDIIIHGAARGADRIAGQEATDLGMEVREYPADWTKYGRAAGIKRNLAMLEEEPDLVVAFHDFLPNSRGTAHTIRHARLKGIHVEHIKH